MAMESPAEQLSEKELVEGCRAGDRDALNELVRRYQPAVLRVAASMIGTYDVEDLVQDIFIKIVRRIRSFEGRSALFTWIYEITVNHCRDEIRRRRRRRWFSLQAASKELNEQAAADFNSISNQVETKDLQRLVRSEISRLPEKYRELIVLRDLEGLSYEEVAAVTGLEVKLVKSRLHQGCQLLLTRMEQYVKELAHG